VLCKAVWIEIRPLELEDEIATHKLPGNLTLESKIFDFYWAKAVWVLRGRAVEEDSKTKRILPKDHNVLLPLLVVLLRLS